MPRIHCPTPLAQGSELALPAAAAKHVQVLRLQPGDALTVFNGEGGEWDAAVTRMHKQGVDIRVGTHHAVEREAPQAIHMALGMPANERMDWLVEKATELGVSSITPLMTARSVVRLQGERADKRLAHWQAVAVSACEQCGRNRVPVIHPIQTLSSWFNALPASDGARWLLGFAPDAALVGASPVPTTILSGPEGGLTPEEETLALQHGFAWRGLGPRVLRAETAAITALTWATYPHGCPG